MTIDPALLAQFLKIYETGGIGRAAAELNLSQPALSKSLRRLEDRLRVRLFVRSAVGIAPTAFAHTLAKHARMVQTELRNAESAVEELRGATRGHVELGASPAVAAALLPAVSIDLWENRPGLRLSVMEGMSEALMTAVREGRLECALCTATPIPGESELVSEPLFTDRYAVLAGRGHPLAAARDVALSDLAAHPWVLGPPSAVVRGFFDNQFTAAGLAPPIPQIETMSILHIKEAVLTGRFLSFIPLGPVEGEIRRGEIQMLIPDSFRLTRTVAVVYRAGGTLSPGGHAVIESVRNAARARLAVDMLAPPSLDKPGRPRKGRAPAP